MSRFFKITTIALALIAIHPGDAFSQRRGRLAGAKTEQLVPAPAAYGSKIDKKGNSWNFQQNGYLNQSNTSQLMSSCLVLRLQGNTNFYNYQPMMTADGKEYVLTNNNNQPLMGLNVTRRVRFLEKEGAVRYLEVFTNPSASPISITVELQNNFGSRLKDFYSDRGVAKPAKLGKRETGILVRPKQKSYGKALAFVVAAPGSRVKPTLNHQNGRYDIHFGFPLTVPANSTVSIMHMVAQVDDPQKVDSKTLQKIFKPLSLSRQIKTIRRDLRNTLLNYGGGGEFGGLSLLTSMTIEGLGVDRSKSDVLALGEKTRLLGTSSCGELKMGTEYGEAVIPFEQVAAIVGGNRGRSNLARAFLRDGQVFTGTADASDLRFVMPNGGKLELDVASLDRLVRSKQPDEGKWDEGVVALLETYQGDRIAMQGGDDVQFECVTPWGALKFSLDDILWLSPPEEEPVGHHIEFKDGSRFFAFLTGSAVTLKSKLFGTREIHPQQIRAIITSSAIARAKDPDADPDRPLGQAHVVLAGGQRLVGQVVADNISVITNSELIEITPETIRLMHNARDEIDDSFEDTSPFQIDLWGGGVVLGYVKETVIPIRVRNQVWRVPIEDIVDFVSPVPRISDASRQKIASLIRDLGSDDWESRESASEALGEYGFMAKPLLNESLIVSPDPEVQRRIEKLLDGLE